MMKFKTILTCVAVIAALWALRCVLAGNFQYYGFIIFNIVLATIPLLLEIPFAKVSRYLQGAWAKTSKLFLAALWMLFIPNTFYLLTDFMHLNSDVLVNQREDGQRFGIDYLRGDGIYVFDSLLLLVATVYGAYVGGLALLHAYNFFKRRMSVTYARIAMSLIILLSATGVYIGRFGRWNSWEGLIEPWNIATDLLSSLSGSQILERFLWVILAAVLFQLLSVWCVYEIQRRLQVPVKSKKT